MFPINSKVLKVMEGKGRPMKKLGKLGEMLYFNIVERNSLVGGQVIIVGITLNCLRICQLAGSYFVAPWRSSYPYDTNPSNKAWTQVLRRFKSYSRRVGDLRWWEPLTMVPAGNKQTWYQSFKKYDNSPPTHTRARASPALVYRNQVIL